MNFELRHPQPPAPLLPASQSCDLNGKGADSTAVQVCLRLSFLIVSKQFRLARSAVAKAWLRLPFRRAYVIFSTVHFLIVLSVKKLFRKKT